MVSDPQGRVVRPHLTSNQCVVRRGKAGQQRQADGVHVVRDH